MRLEEDLMQVALANLWSCHVAASFDKQLHLADLIGDLPWHFDMGSGMLSFHDRYCWHVQLLGTESEQTQTWLWGKMGTLYGENGDALR